MSDLSNNPLVNRHAAAIVEAVKDFTRKTERGAEGEGAGG